MANTQHPSPLLFDLGERLPTTRTIAQLVKEGGIEALPGAVERSDQVRYQEVSCRSALNRVEGMPFHWTLNPYRGCTHGCHYCFARRYQTQFEMDSSDQFSSVILVKLNFADVLRRELAKPSWKKELVALGTATDPYQPIEGHYRITRRALELLCESATPVGIITKGPLVVRDRDVLAELSRRASCTVYVSVPTVDEDVWRSLEPGTAPPLQRLRAVRQLQKAGVRTGVLLAPIIPELTTQPERMERTLRAIADHGAAFVGGNLLHLQDGTRVHFLNYLSREYPQLLPLYEQLYKGKYAPRLYVEKTQALLRQIKSKFRLFDRPEGKPASQAPAPGPAAPNQGEFLW